MCGILAAFLLKDTPQKNRFQAINACLKLRHRGPDEQGSYQSEKGDVVFVHQRLQIIDTTECGRQPFIRGEPGQRIVWGINSEIYNHWDIREKELKGFPSHSTSDSEVVGSLYYKYGLGNEIINLLDGMFAVVLYDEKDESFIVFRDPMGVNPLYWGRGSQGEYWFASEMKGLQDQCVQIDLFPPGHVYRSKTKALERWYNPSWLTTKQIPQQQLDYSLIRDTFIEAVKKRLMTDVPLGILLSGGLDSSLVCSIAVRHLQESEHSFMKGRHLHTFSIGLPGSPDLVAARKVAKFLGTVHHEYTFTPQEGIDALYNLVYHIESFEQVRAAVPLYLLSRRIKSTGIKVVLSGEGADEAFGGYLYFHKAPSAEEFFNETVRKVSRLHQWDVLRANKSTAAWGLETRVPFLDKKFLDVVMNIDPQHKMINLAEKPDGIHPKLEKYILRKAFDLAQSQAYLPEDVLWRQKEQFSDGVGYDWVDGLRDYASQVVSDEKFSQRHITFPEETPRNKEYYLLREYFSQHFPSSAALQTVPKGLSIACSTPEALSWDPQWANIHEISGRALNVHQQAEGFEIQHQKKQKLDNITQINGFSQANGIVKHH